MGLEIQNAENINELQSIYFKQDFAVARLKLRLDIQQIREATKKVLEQYKPIEKDYTPGYLGLGLQKASDDEKNSYYQNVNSWATKGYLANKLNEVGEMYKDVFDALNGIQLKRARLLVAKPGYRMQLHTDGPFTANLHVPIFTDENAKFFIDGEKYHLPADGNAYLVNARRPHRIENHSSSDRIHIVFLINPACFSEWSQDQLVNFANESFFNQHREKDVQIVEPAVENDFFWHLIIYKKPRQTIEEFRKELPFYFNSAQFTQHIEMLKKEGKIKNDAGFFLSTYEGGVGRKIYFSNSDEALKFHEFVQREIIDNRRRRELKYWCRIEASI